MKIDLKDIEKAVKWIRENSNNDRAVFEIIDNKLIVSVMDKYQASVEILIYESGSMMPKIKKTDLL